MGICGAVKAAEKSLAGAIKKLADVGIETLENDFNDFKAECKDSPIPHLKTVTHQIVLAGSDFVKMIKYDFTDTKKTLAYKSLLGKHIQGKDCNKANWLRIQNSYIARGKGESKMKAAMEVANPTAVAKGNEYIWGYGGDFPSDELIGDLFVMTMLGGFLEYDSDSDKYVLNFTDENSDEIRRALIKDALSGKSYLKTKVFFEYSIEAGEFKLRPVKCDFSADDDGLVGAGSSTPGDDKWTLCMTGAVTIAFYLFENLHACLHLVTGAVATAVLGTDMDYEDRSMVKDIRELFLPLVENVFLKQTEVVTLLFGGDTMLDGATFNADHKAVVAAAYEQLVEIVKYSESDSNEALLNKHIYPDNVKEEHKQYFCPGAAEEVVLTREFARECKEIFKKSGKVADAEYVAASEKQLNEQCDNGFLAPLKEIDVMLFAGLVTGAVFHSHSFMTKIGFTPLVSPWNTLTPLTEFDSHHSAGIETLFGTVDEVDEDHEYGSYDMDSSNDFFHAVKAHSKKLDTLRAGIQAKYGKSKRPVKPYFYFSNKTACKMGYQNTATTYV